MINSTRRAFSVQQKFELGGYRYFASSQTNLSILDFFRSKKDTATLTKKSTDELISKVEKDDVSLTSDINKKIPILGKRNVEQLNRWKTKMNNFKVESWVPEKSKYYYGLKQYDSNDLKLEKYGELINNLLLTSYNKFYPNNQLESISQFNSNLNNDLSLKFKFFKYIQITFGLKISDMNLTQINTLQALNDFLKTELKPNKTIINEKLPNAIYLNPQDFKNTNVYIDSSISPKEKQKKFNKLIMKLNKVEKLEKQKLIQA
ncbi:hypothetical protein PACTADRAFT_51993 [Pachysolen tannophilus NRRL Y-2460]|uniref:Large ribosomal subunit protein mL50 n=1 Tax=Pachysolen tannophilus NRRL Y-2460 TaxID=669874 RepID=A0A1E4TNZ3_PACTA|nr:hypothetical protein PACTADRAFT_51993 [Pachysolen tannophilus NRRL Y-2460]